MSLGHFWPRVNLLAQRQLRPAGHLARMASTNGSAKEPSVVPKEEVVRFVADCLVKLGAEEKNARLVGHHLMVSDYRGHFSHGMNRLHLYIDEIKRKLADPKAVPEIVNSNKATALVDGHNGLGQIVGHFCMELALSKASEFGVGLVSARGSNHFGICGYYTLMAVERGMVGFACTNSSPLVAPTRSRASALGTNPISLAMGAAGGDEFVLDMATSAKALGKIELARRKGERIGEGWAKDKDGRVTTDPQAAIDAHILMPLGGEERDSGYKGYGLATMVEVLCGVLSGAQYGPNVRRWGTDDGIANLGHCFLAINPGLFAPGAGDRLAHLLSQLRAMPREGEEPVLVAGDPERAAMARVDRDGGLRYHENQIKNCDELAESLGVPSIRLVKSCS